MIIAPIGLLTHLVGNEIIKDEIIDSIDVSIEGGLVSGLQIATILKVLCHQHNSLLARLTRIEAELSRKQSKQDRKGASPYAPRPIR